MLLYGPKVLPRRGVGWGGAVLGGGARNKKWSQNPMGGMRTAKQTQLIGDIELGKGREWWWNGVSPPPQVSTAALFVHS